MTKPKNILRTILLLFLIVLFSEAGSMNVFSLVDRGVEVRYTKINLKEGEVFPKEIKIQDTVYPLFKTKEEAYNYVRDMSVKSDITIVYVVSKEEKDSEMLTIEK